jgi:replicative superfamily II helicase
MARRIAENLPEKKKASEKIQLVQRFLQTEVSDDFELIEMLNHGVAVHHAGLSDETRALVEWLAEEEELSVLCATTTIAQGINFPVSSVFLSTHKYPYGNPMNPREFWNLAGRAGRFGQDSVGVVGLAGGANEKEVTKFVKEQTGALVSRLVEMLADVADAGELSNLQSAFHRDDWRDFRCYIAHLMRESESIDEVLSQTEDLLRSTFGYSDLRSRGFSKNSKQADALLNATNGYVREIAQHPENVTLADSTGFAPEGVRSALLGLGKLEQNLSVSDWEPASLFGGKGDSTLPNLIGVMMNVRELKSLEDLGGDGTNKQQVASITQDWVNGSSIEEIAKRYFSNDKGNTTRSVSKACKAIYRNLCNMGPWGLSALSKMPTSGLDFDELPKEVVRRINSLPSMIYHGVKTEPAVLLRMNAVPRSVAEKLGATFESEIGVDKMTIKNAREFLKTLGDAAWESAAPKNAAMSGADYRQVWRRLSGEKLD